MKNFQVFNTNPASIVVKTRRPYVSGLIAGLCIVAFGCFVLLFNMFASENGFFKVMKATHAWMFWMFGIVFLTMGVSILWGSFRNLLYPLRCELDKMKNLLSIWPVPFTEKGLLEIPLTEVKTFEVIDSVRAWIEQVEFFKNNPHSEQLSAMKRWPQFLHFAQLKLEGIKRKASASERAPKDMVPADDPANEQNTDPKMLLRIRLHNHEPVLLDWMGTFKREELFTLAANLNQFLARTSSS